MRYAYGHNDQRTNEIVLRFVAALIPHVDRGWPAGTQGIGVCNGNGELIAGVVFYHWNKRNGTIEIAAAARPGTNWFTRETIRHALGYAFDDCDCQMVIMRVRAEDERTLAQLARFGFTFLKVPRLYGRGNDGVMCLLTYETYVQHPAVRDRIKKAA